MTCSGSFVTSYFFWAMLSGLFVGFAISRLMRFLPMSDVKARHWKWIMFSFYLSVGIILALCAAFVPSSLCSVPRKLRVSQDFLDQRILYFAAAAAVAGLLGLRFKKAVGLPLVFVIAIGVVAVPILRQPWYRMEPGEPVAELRVLAFVDGKRSIEFTPRGGDTYFLQVPGTGITVEAAVLQASDYYFFIDKPQMYRLNGIAPAGSGAQVPVLANDQGDAAGRFQEWLQKIAQHLPGWEVKSLRAESLLLLPLFKYNVYLAGEDGPAVKLVQPQQ